MDEKVLKMIYEKDSEIAKKPIKFFDEVYKHKEKNEGAFQIKYKF